MSEAEEKALLIKQMWSQDNQEALAAVEALREKGWLSDGSLQGAALWWANLRGANLSGAHLNWADLWEADLRGTDLNEADLSEADIRCKGSEAVTHRHILKDI